MPQTRTAILDDNGGFMKWVDGTCVIVGTAIWRITCDAQGVLDTEYVEEVS